MTNLWIQLKDIWVSLATDALTNLARSHPDHHFYALIIHGGDNVEDGVIGTPLLAANSVESAQSRQLKDDGFWSSWWSPEDFGWPELDTPLETFVATEKAIKEEATRKNTAHWHRTLKKHQKVMVEVAQALAALAPKILSTTDDFVVFIFDEEQGPKLAKQTIDAPLFARLFPEQLALKEQREVVAGYPTDRRVAFYISRLGIFEGIDSEEAQKELISLGTAAIGQLIKALPDPNNGWVVAKILGHIGVASAEVINALRQTILDKKPAASWSANALGALGDHDFLLDIVDAHQYCAAQGLAVHLLSWYPGCQNLDYSYIAKLLDLGGEVQASIDEALKPGCSVCSITKDEVETALSALHHRHATIRSHAARVLGDKRLGKRLSGRILDSLLHCALEDADADVRRMAVLSIGHWAKHADPYRESLAPLLEHPNEPLQRAARSAMGK